MRKTLARMTAVATVLMLLAVIMPTAQAQVPPPPMPPTVGIACTAPSFPILDWVDSCLPSSATIVKRYVLWTGDLADWLRCDILGGAAC